MNELAVKTDLEKKKLIADITGSVAGLKNDLMLELIKHYDGKHTEMMKLVHEQGKEKNKEEGEKHRKGDLVGLTKSIENLATNQTKLIEHIAKPKKIRGKKVNGEWVAESS